MLTNILSLRAVGLELEEDQIKCAQVSIVKDTVHIEKILSYHGKLSKEQKTLNQQITVSALAASDVLVRPLDIKLTKEKDIQSVLAFQAEPHLPFPVESAVLQSIKVSSTQNSSHRTLLACRKERVKDHLDVWANLSIEPELVSCTPVALALFGYYFSPDPKNDLLHCILHLNSHEIICILSQQGKLLASRSFNLETADTNLATLEIVKTITAFLKNYKVQQPFHLLLTGDVQIIPNLIQIISQTFQVSVLTPKSSNISTEEIQKFAVPIGLALSAITSQKPINFRQQDFVRFPWQRMIRPTAIYISLCMLTAVLLFYAGNFWMQNQEDQLQQDYINFLKLIPNAIEGQQETNQAINETIDKQSHPGEMKISLDDLSSRLSNLEYKMQPSPDLYPLQPNIPRVSDVLAWLSTHPKIHPPDDIQIEPAIQIENITYTLVKRPDKHKKREKYQVKLELEFTTSTPKFAREFHDALIIPNQMVDPNHEIKWNANRDRYRTSFFLKDKTVYPIGSSL